MEKKGEWTREAENTHLSRKSAGGWIVGLGGRERQGGLQGSRGQQLRDHTKVLWFPPTHPHLLAVLPEAQLALLD